MDKSGFASLHAISSNMDSVYYVHRFLSKYLQTSVVVTSLLISHAGIQQKIIGKCKKHKLNKFSLYLMIYVGV